jgi:hypothetical protein
MRAGSVPHSAVETVFASACLPSMSSSRPTACPSSSALTRLMHTESLSPRLPSKPWATDSLLTVFFPSLGRVFTVFSTSKDHGQGRKAMAGCILVDVDKIQVINRSPAYKNKYIHHRTSVGCDLSDDQVSMDSLPLTGPFSHPSLSLCLCPLPASLSSLR